MACNFRKINQDDDRPAPLSLKDVESASKPLPTLTHGNPTETNYVKLLPSDSHQYILSDYWCQHPIKYTL